MDNNNSEADLLISLGINQDIFKTLDSTLKKMIGMVKSSNLGNNLLSTKQINTFEKELTKTFNNILSKSLKETEKYNKSVLTSVDNTIKEFEKISQNAGKTASNVFKSYLTNMTSTSPMLKEMSAYYKKIEDEGTKLIKSTISQYEQVSQAAGKEASKTFKSFLTDMTSKNKTLTDMKSYYTEQEKQAKSSLNEQLKFKIFNNKESEKYTKEEISARKRLEKEYTDYIKSLELKLAKEIRPAQREMLENFIKDSSSRVIKNKEDLHRLKMDFNKAYSEITSTVKSTSSQVDKETRKIAMGWRGALFEGTTLGHKMVTTAEYVTAGSMLYGIQSAVAGIKNAIVESDRAITSFNAILGLSTDESKKLENQVYSLATVYGGSVDEYNKVALALGRAGLQSTELANGMKLVSQMALVSGDDLGNITEMLSSWKTVYPEDKLSDIANAMTKVSNESLASIDGMKTMTSYVLSMGSQAGFTSEALIALMGSFKDLGKADSIVGTEIRRLFEQISGSSKEVRKTYWDLGIDVNKFSELLRNASTKAEKDALFISFFEELGTKSPDDIAKVTKSLQILDKQTFSSAIKVSQSIDKLKNNLKNNGDELEIASKKMSLSFDKMYERMVATIEKSVDAFKNGFKYVIPDTIADFDKLQIQVKSSFETIMALLGNVVGVIVNNLDKIVALLAGIAAFKGMTMLVEGFIALKDAINMAKIATTGLSIAFATLEKNKVMLLIATLVGLGTYAYEKYQEIANKAEYDALKQQKQNSDKALEQRKQEINSIISIIKTNQSAILKTEDEFAKKQLKQSIQNLKNKLKDLGVTQDQYDKLIGSKAKPTGGKGDSFKATGNMPLEGKDAQRAAQDALDLKNLQDKLDTLRSITKEIVLQANEESRISDESKSKLNDAQKEIDLKQKQLNNTKAATGIDDYNKKVVEAEIALQEAKIKQQEVVLDIKKEISKQDLDAIKIQEQDNKKREEALLSYSDYMQKIQKEIRDAGIVDKDSLDAQTKELDAWYSSMIQDVSEFAKKYSEILTEEELTAQKAKLTAEIDKLRNIKLDDITLNIQIKGIEGQIAELEALKTGFNDFDKEVQIAQLEYQKDIKEARGNASKIKAADAKLDKKIKDETLKNLSYQVNAYSDLAGAIGGALKEGSKAQAAFMIISKAGATVDAVAAIIKAWNSAPFPANLPAVATTTAAIIPLLSSIGASITQLNGGTKSTYDQNAAMPDNKGTGTVLGDSSKATESITNSLSILEKLAKPEFSIMSQMRDSLQNIENRIGGVTSQIIRSGGFKMGEGTTLAPTTNSTSGLSNAIASTAAGSLAVNNGLIGGMNYMLGGVNGIAINPYLAGFSLVDSIFFKGKGTQAIGKALNNLTGGLLDGVIGGLDKLTGGVLGKISTTIFGGKTSQELSDYGINFSSQLLTEAMTSLAGSSYQVIKTHTSGGWFSSSKDSYNSIFQNIDSSTKKQFELILSGLYDTVSLASEALGYTQDYVDQQLSDFYVNIGKISLKGLTGEEIQSKLTEVFGKIGDEIASDIYGASLLGFQKVGEGLYETLSRVATGISEASYYINKLGSKFEETVFTNIIDQQGDVAIEALSQSIIKGDSAIWGFNSTFTRVMENFTGTAEELFQTYKYITGIRLQLAGVGIDSVFLTETLITAAGGFESLSSSLSSYIENFLSDTEQATYKIQALNYEFEQLNIVMPQTKEEFKSLIESVDLTTQSGQDLYGRLLQLSDAFVDVYDSIDSIIKSANEVHSAANKIILDAKSTITNDVLSRIDSMLSSLSAISSFANELRGNVSGKTFTEAYNEMVDAVKAGSKDVADKTTTAISLAKTNLETQNKLATSSYQVAFNNAVMANKFEGITPVAQATINDMISEFDDLLGVDSDVIKYLKSINTSANNISYNDYTYNKNLTDAFKDANSYLEDLYLGGVTATVIVDDQNTISSLIAKDFTISVGDSWDTVATQLSNGFDWNVPTNFDEILNQFQFDWNKDGLIDAVKTIMPDGSSKLEFDWNNDGTVDLSAIIGKDGQLEAIKTNTAPDGSATIAGYLSLLYQNALTATAENTKALSQASFNAGAILGTQEKIDFAKKTGLTIGTDSFNKAITNIQGFSTASNPLSYLSSIFNSGDLTTINAIKSLGTLAPSTATQAVNDLRNSLTSQYNTNYNTAVANAGAIYNDIVSKLDGNVWWAKNRLGGAEMSSIAGLTSQEISIVSQYPEVSGYLYQDEWWNSLRNKILSEKASVQNTISKQVVPFADGGIVTAPTLGMIGEAGYREAVIPLKNPNDPLSMNNVTSELSSIKQLLIKLVADNSKMLTIDRAMYANTVSA